MVYDLNPQSWLIFLTGFFTVILWNILTDYFGLPFPFFLFVLVWVVALFSIRFRLKINGRNLVYQVLIFNKFIIQKEIHPDHINQLKFVRVGWARKAAIIKVNTGINCRLTVLASPKAYEHLNDFAEKHGITIFKTKDYLILERMK